MEIKEFFNKRAAAWDDDLPKILPSRKAIAMLCGASDKTRILDIACGTGVMEPELLEYAPVSITGIDFAENMIEVAKSKFGHINNISFEACDLLEFEALPFDIALMYNAYPHFPDKEAVLKKVASLLVSGGRFTVAHGAGRQVINAHHKESASKVSVGLDSAENESAVWHKWFNVDTLIDRPDIYVISGTVK